VNVRIPSISNYSNRFSEMELKSKLPTNFIVLHHFRKDKTEQILRDHGLLPPDDGEDMENVQLTNDYYNKIIFIEYVTFFFAYAGQGAAMIEYELRYNNEQGETMNDFNTYHLSALLCINAICTIAACICIFSRYLLILRW
jgi:hypothetical protein